MPVHLTLFHALAPSSLDEARRQLSLSVRRPAPRAEIAGVMDLGGGVAFRIASNDLDSIREELADHFHGVLGAQDSAGWRPHVTIQNKVAPPIARRLLVELERQFVPRRLGIAGLSLHRYVGGPWERVARYSFR